MNGLSENMISFMDKATDKHGYTNIEGKIIINAAFENAFSFKDGLAIVNLNDANYYMKAGVIDKDGKYVIQPIYSNIEYLASKLLQLQN